MQNNENPNNNYCSIHISSWNLFFLLQTDSPSRQKEQDRTKKIFEITTAVVSIYRLRTPSSPFQTDSPPRQKEQDRTTKIFDSLSSLFP